MRLDKIERLTYERNRTQYAGLVLDIAGQNYQGQTASASVDHWILVLADGTTTEQQSQLSVSVPPGRSFTAGLVLELGMPPETDLRGAKLALVFYRWRQGFWGSSHLP